MNIRRAFRAAMFPRVGRGTRLPGDFCGPPPRGSVRPRERLVVKAGDTCTACGQPLEPVVKLQESVRVEGAAWWCARCGQQFREGEA
jgi:hypothetical protein